MSIQFACACGQKLAAREEYAGQRVKCTACGEVHTVPGNEPELPPTREPMAEVIRFHCSCGQVCQAKPEFAGRNTRCPRCSTILTIPVGSITAQAPGPRRPSAVQADEPIGRVRDQRPDYDEDDMEAGDRPRRRRSIRKKSKKWVWVAVAAGLLLVGGAIGLWLLRGGIDSDFDLVPRDAQFFVTVRPADAVDSPLGKKLMDRMGPFVKSGLEEAEKRVGLSLKDAERTTFVMPDLTNPEVFWIIVHTGKAYDKDKILALIPDAEEKNFDGKKYHYRKSNNFALHFYSRRILLLATEKGLQKCLDRNWAKSGPLDESLEVASKKKNQLVMAVNLPPALMNKARDEVDKVRNQLPREQQPLVKLFLDVKTAHISLAIKEDLDFEMVLAFADADRAIQAEKEYNEYLAEAKKNLPKAREQAKQAFQLLGLRSLDRLMKEGEKQLDVKPTRNGKTLTLTTHLEGSTLLDIIDELAGVNLGGGLGAAGKVRQAAQRTHAQNNFKQITIALHSYADAHQGQMPPAVIRHSQTRQPLYSWRVALLPYLEEGALYNQLHLNEPWNSAHNLPLLRRTPKVFQMPGDLPEQEGMTFIQVFTGPNTPFNFDQGPRLPASFPDGTSNTILIAEASRAVNWASPQDIVYSNKLPPRMFLGTRFVGGTMVGLADGSVRVIDRSVSDDTLRRAIDPADGLLLGPDW
ncbi:MAG TPA: DUF1559 domain-containing protein [Gemmataceae bacterium]|nr:DUF1559 domain-containing protein [Gemmataceae bacterium]